METVDIRLLVTCMVFEFFSPWRLKTLWFPVLGPFLNSLYSMKNILFRQVYFSDIYSVQSVILILKVFDVKPRIQIKLFSGLPKTGHFITAWEVNMLEQHNYLKEYLFFRDLGVILDGSAQVCHKELRFLLANVMELGLYRAINKFM